MGGRFGGRVNIDDIDMKAWRHNVFRLHRRHAYHKRTKATVLSTFYQHLQPTNDLRTPLQAYADHFRNRDGSVWVQNTYGPKPPPGSVILVPSTDEIEELRPKSPTGQHGGSSFHHSR